MTGKKIIDNILIALCLLTTISVLGLFYYNSEIYKQPPVDNKAEFDGMIKDQRDRLLISPYKLPKMILNLKSRGTRLRYLDTEIFLTPFSETDAEAFKKFESRIQDVIIAIASKMSTAEISSVSGKILFEERIKKQINETLGKASVKEIHFGKFIIQ